MATYIHIIIRIMLKNSQVTDNINFLLPEYSEKELLFLGAFLFFKTFQ